MAHKDNHLLENPDFEIPSNNYILKIWMAEDRRWHRLDGPAAITVSKRTYKIVARQYYINGIGLFGFYEIVKYKKNRTTKIFDYAKKHPEFINEICLLAKHNNWLSEKELLLLTSMDMFR
jgi:hypothetical protein